MTAIRTTAPFAPAPALALALAVTCATPATHAQSFPAPDGAAPPAPSWPAHYLPSAPPPPAPAEREKQALDWFIRIEAVTALTHTRSSFATPGAASTGSDSVGFGLSSAVQISPHGRAGLSHLGAAYSSVTGFEFSAAPYVELFLPLGKRWELYAQLGELLEVQVQRGAVTGGWGMYAAAGARFGVTDWLWVGASLRGYLAGSDGLRVGGATLAHGEAMLALGLEVGFRF